LSYKLFNKIHLFLILFVVFDNGKYYKHNIIFFDNNIYRYIDYFFKNIYFQFLKQDNNFFIIFNIMINYTYLVNNIINISYKTSMLLILS